MQLRPILSRIYPKRHRFANFCTLKFVQPFETAANPPSSSSPKENSPEKGYVFSYLVNSCGLSPSKALSASKKVSFDGLDKPNAVLKFLEKQGFSKTQISELVSRYPPVLVSKPEKSISPKIEFFLRFFSGMPGNDVLTTVSRYPHLLTSSLEHRLEPMYDYLKGVIGDDKLEILFRGGSWCFNFDFPNRVIPNVEFLRGQGVTKSNIKFSLFHFPEIYCLRLDEFKKVVKEVKGMGFDDPTKSMFVLAIHARLGKSNLGLWDRCYKVYSKWGWSEEDILMAFRKHPNCMLLSEKKISRVLGFVVDEVGRDSRLVVMCPYILFYNMEKRIVPRCSVLLLLASKGLVKKDWGLTTVLCPTEKVFINKFVTRYMKELPEIYDIYLSKKSKIVKV